MNTLANLLSPLANALSVIFHSQEKYLQLDLQLLPNHKYEKILDCGIKLPCPLNVSQRMWYVIVKRSVKYNMCISLKVLLLTVLLAGSVTAICYNDTDCGSPEGVVKCNTTSRTCECLVTCYHLMPIGINGTCVLNDCTSLDDDDRCRDGIKSRLTALLLSIFLINFGAANFYIERYELAAVQLFLGLLLCCVQVR